MFKKQIQFFKLYWVVGIIISLGCSVYSFINNDIFSTGFSGALGLIGTILFIYSNNMLNFIKGNKN